MVINSEWKIESDDLNVIVMRKKSKNDPRSKADAPDSYENHYFATIAGALIFILEREIRGTGLKDLKTVAKKIEAIEADINRAVKKLTATSANVLDR